MPRWRTSWGMEMGTPIGLLFRSVPDPHRTPAGPTHILAQGVTVCRGTLERLDRAFDAFHRRCRAGKRRASPVPVCQSVDSVQWEDRNGWRLDTQRRRLHLHGLGDVKVRQHRGLRGTAKAITVTREGRRWWVSVRCGTSRRNRCRGRAGRSVSTSVFALSSRPATGRCSPIGGMDARPVRGLQPRNGL